MFSRSTSGIDCENKVFVKVVKTKDGYTIVVGRCFIGILMLLVTAIAGEKLSLPVKDAISQAVKYYYIVHPAPQVHPAKSEDLAEREVNRL
jgi:hypothetical protein